MSPDGVRAEVEKLADTIAYLLCRVGPSTKTKIVKLLFLADRYHIATHGTPMLQDPYDRTHGLLPSHVMELLEQSADLMAAGASDSADARPKVLMSRLVIDDAASAIPRRPAPTVALDTL